LAPLTVAQAKASRQVIDILSFAFAVVRSD
jgi:hypothetical protein